MVNDTNDKNDKEDITDRSCPFNQAVSAPISAGAHRHPPRAGR